MKKRMLFVFNPNAGRGRIRSKLCSIIETLSADNTELIVFSTRKKLDAKEITKEYIKENKIDLVACSGGDGTLNEVVNGIMESDHVVPVGYIPSGTTNDFGYSLHIPKDMEAAAKIIANHKAMLCDVGSMNNNYFTYTAAFGLFTDVSYDTPQNAKNILGRLAYILNGMTRLPNVKSFHLKVIHDGVTVEDEFLVGMVANSNSVAGFRGITGHKVELDDGLFELIMIRTPRNIVELSGIVNDLIHGNLSNDKIYYRRVSKASVISKEEIPWSLDGEFGGTTTEADIVIHKQVIPYICDVDAALSNQK